MLKLSKLFSGSRGHSTLRGVGLALLFAVLTYSVPARADVPLRRADIEEILNRVEFIPRGRSARTARVSDFLSVGDALRTAAASRAELRFNDGSLARVGERATFRFIPNTRNFRLSDGTMLLLVPPGRGRSTIQTPSAITGIQGSAVAVRHVQARNLTVIMALTDNPHGGMTVTMADCDQNDDCTAEYSLSAGQMALIQDDQVEVLNFDLLHFYETSTIIAGLELDNPESNIDLGPDLNQVRQETLDALDEYTPIEEEQSTIINPAMLSVTSTAETVTNEPWLLNPDPGDAPLTVDRSTTPPPAGLLAETSTSASGNTESTDSGTLGSTGSGTSVENQESTASGTLGSTGSGTSVDNQEQNPPTPAPEPEPAVPTPAPEPEPVVPTPEPEPEPVVPTPEPEPEPVVPTPEPEPEPVVPTPEPEPEPVVPPTPAPEPEPVVPTPAPEPEPVVPPTPAPEPDPVVPTPAPEPDPVVPPTPGPEPDPVVPTPAPEPDPVVPPTPGPEPDPVVPTPAPEPDPVVPTPAPEPEPVVPPTPAPEPEPVVPTPGPEPDPVVPTPAPEPDPVVPTPAPEPEPVVPPTPAPEPDPAVPTPGPDGPGQAEPPPFNEFPDKNELPTPSLEEGPGQAAPPPFENQ